MRVTTPRDLGALIRDLRRQKGLSQEDLARQVGVSRQWIIGLEQGRARAFGLVLRTLASLGLAIEIVEVKSRNQGIRTVDLDRLLSAFEEH